MPSKMFFSVAVVAALSTHAFAQVTLTGCHMDNGQEVCFLPGGMETTIASSTQSPVTSGSLTSTNIPTPTAPTSVTASTTATAQTTAITGCHMHETTQFCVKGDGAEVQVLATATGTTALPTSYNGCHTHGTEMFCMTVDGQEVEVVAKEATETSESTAETSGENCHFHAGVEHCTGGTESESESESSCERKQRDYNLKLRIGLIFVMFAASLIGVYAPMVFTKLLRWNTSGIVFTIVKQCGTGVIISTALVHLLTHSILMFANPCLGELKYESTATSIAMAAAFVASFIEYSTHRLAHWRQAQRAAGDNENHAASSSVPDKASPPTEISPDASPLASLGHHHGHANQQAGANDDPTSVLALEAGIVFHSLLLGITVVVAPDSVFVPLFIVIILHQMFEGLALGARIASIDTTNSSRLSKIKLWILPLSFAVVTPIGMAIGCAVLHTFNGNSPNTIIALGSLDAVSSGILMWVGFVDMWARDWMFGDLREAPLKKTAFAGLGLIAGMGLMSFLGKWA